MDDQGVAIRPISIGNLRGDCTPFIPLDTYYQSAIFGEHINIDQKAGRPAFHKDSGVVADGKNGQLIFGGRKYSATGDRYEKPISLLTLIGSARGLRRRVIGGQ